MSAFREISSLRAVGFAHSGVVDWLIDQVYDA
jgi:hypothetical protein